MVLDARRLPGELDLWAAQVHSEDPLPAGRAWVGAALARSLGDHPADPAPFQAEILEMDRSKRILYLATGPDIAVEPGLAQVHPFDYLRAPADLLDHPSWAGLHGRLADHLAAAEGSLTALPAGSGTGAWASGWGIVWGPPGTGKTFTLGQQVAALLTDPSERVLILSTTHKAADQAALELGRAAKARGLDLTRIRRVATTRDEAAFLQALRSHIRSAWDEFKANYSE